MASSIPSGGNFIFADFETPRCQFCTKLPEMSDLCYLGKTRLTPQLNLKTNEFSDHILVVEGTETSDTVSQ